MILTEDKSYYNTVKRASQSTKNLTKNACRVLTSSCSLISYLFAHTRGPNLSLNAIWRKFPLSYLR